MRRVLRFHLDEIIGARERIVRRVGRQHVRVNTRRRVGRKIDRRYRSDGLERAARNVHVLRQRGGSVRRE